MKIDLYFIRKNKSRQMNEIDTMKKLIFTTCAKIDALAGNRTRAACLEGMYDTISPPVLVEKPVVSQNIKN